EHLYDPRLCRRQLLHVRLRLSAYGLKNGCSNEWSNVWLERIHDRSAGARDNYSNGRMVSFDHMVPGITTLSTKQCLANNRKLRCRAKSIRRTASDKLVRCDLVGRLCYDSRMDI